MTLEKQGAVAAPAKAWAGRYTLPNTPRSPSLARLLIRQALDECPRSTVETAELLVSELVTNGIRHAETALVLEIRFEQPGIRVAVEDHSADGLIPVAVSSPETDSGRGLRIVDALAVRWGWQRTSTGKLVWFELA